MKESVYPKLKEFHELANIYIKDGYVIKYRWHSEDENNLDNVLGKCGINNPLYLDIQKGLVNSNEEDRNLMIQIISHTISDGNLVIELAGEFTIYNPKEMKSMYENRIKFLESIGIRPKVNFGI